MPSRSFTLPIALPIVLVGLFSLSCGMAAAASPEAWETMRKDVEASCLASAAPHVREPQIVVDPFGSESYGLAFLNGVAAEGGTTRSLVCIYDKVAKTSEIGGTMALETAVPQLQPDPAAASVDAVPTATPAQEATPVPAAPATPAGAAAAASGPVEPAPSPSTEASPTGATEGNAAALALQERFLSPSTAPAINALPGTASALAASGAEAASAGAEPATKTAALATTPAAPGAPPASQVPGFAGQCDATCAVTIGKLSDSDRTELASLAAEVKRTIDRNAAANLGDGPGGAREAALAMAASVEGQKAGAVAVPTAALTGETSCVLYYYGYSGEASRTVGRHRCAVSEGEGGKLVVEKTSGERMRAEIEPLTGEVAAFVGRTHSGGAEAAYDPATPVDPANSALGNTVGFAAASDGGLLLVSSQMRRFGDRDDFFWVLALDPT